MTNVTILTDDNGVKREYREVKREANVGERVKIIADAGVMLGEYRKGEVYTVTKLYGSFFIDVDGKWGDGTELNLAHDDYVVLEPTDIIHVDGLRYREEKRKAKAGERILIVAAEDAEGLYANGSVQTIREVPEVFGCVLVTGHAQIIYHREYVVITPLDEPATNNITVNLTVNVASSSPSEILKAIVDSVQAELAKFVGAPNNEETRDKMMEVLTNKSRDGIVERAKVDVVELRSDMTDVRNPHLRGRDDIYLLEGHLGMTADFIVNKEKRTIVCLLRGAVTPERIYARGIAKCSPDDCFNAHIGKAIALRRALDLDVPTDYLNTPQPTEPRVGDVVYPTAHRLGGRALTLKERVTGYNHERYGKNCFLTKESSGWIGDKQFRIIDDSRDQETEVTAVA
ncbi:hypothetical protein GOP56_11185 [Brevibacillus sp. 7WMA2]|uniref:hypothetical protein n=1 Tax=Brevibacillus sp. 7WMA2 TaxID=2683193 RepID=UPI0013A75FE0|nr:hypothetical protein [Brevibacillus sp. 7WMA2]QIC06124.1 hypothetical protein GOP56_11185 [Brevibacillus sp. 7WMA2]